MKNLAIKSTLSAAAVALSLGMVMSAKADQVTETLVRGAAVPTKTITFNRAELSTETGRAALEHRVRRAAEQVCGHMSYRESGGLARYTERKECYDQAVSQAMSQVMSQVGADHIASVSN